MTTAADELNTNGLCSLREAITNANNNNQSGSQDCGPGGDPETIFLPAGNYALSIAGTGDDLNVSGDLDILGRVTLIGSGMQATVVDGQQLDRVFHVMNGLGRSAISPSRWKLIKRDGEPDGRRHPGRVGGFARPRSRCE